MVDVDSNNRKARSLSPADERFLDAVVRSGRVKRWHNRSTLHTQTVGEHTYNVLWILIHITDNKVSPDLLRAALAHDMPEYATGDVPKHVKDLPGVRQALEAQERVVFEQLGLSSFQESNLTGTDQILLKWADGLDGALFCAWELKMGNKLLRNPFENYLGYLSVLKMKGGLDLPKAFAILAHLDEVWHDEFNPF